MIAWCTLWVLMVRRKQVAALLACPDKEISITQNDENFEHSFG